MGLEVTLLGTGGSAGVPQIGGADGRGDWGVCDPAEPRNRRTRASIVVRRDHGQRLLVDTSPDMRGQLLACGIPSVDAILYTHAHADHITGLDDVRILNRLIGRPIKAFATPGTLAELEKRFGYAFRPWSGSGFYRPCVVGCPVQPDTDVEIAGLPIRLFHQNHGMTSSLGFRVGNFAYSTDVVDLPDATLDVLGGLDTWVVDCFLRHGRHNAHANLEIAIGWAERLKPRRTILTHMGMDMDWGWLKANLPAGIEPGFDGQVLNIPGTAESC